MIDICPKCGGTEISTMFVTKDEVITKIIWTCLECGWKQKEDQGDSKE